MFFHLGAEVFCAQSCRAVWIEFNIGIERGDQRGIIFLAKMNDRQKAVNDGLLWRQLRSRLRGGKRGFEVSARKLRLWMQVPRPGTRICRQSLAEQRFAFADLIAIDEDCAEGDVGIRCFFWLSLERCAKLFFGFGGILQGEVSHSGLVESFVRKRGLAPSPTEIVEGAWDCVGVRLCFSRGE